MDLEDIWSQLGAPLELVEKGQYAPEKSLQWKFMELKREQVHSTANDNLFWQKGQQKEQNQIFNQNIFNDHQCEPDSQYRCKKCGKILKWVYYGNVKIYEPYTIFYYDFEYINNLEKQSDDIYNKNFTDFKFLIKQRYFTLYLLGRPPGFGYCDFLSQKKHQIPKQIENLCITGDKLCKELEFYADFECGNMNSVIIQKGLKKVKLMLKADTNSLGFTQWFYFGIKFWGEESSLLKINILNCRKSKNLFELGMPIYIGTYDFDDLEGIKWQKLNNVITYKKSKHLRKNQQEQNEKTEHFYKMSFKYIFQQQGERVLFSYLKPYTFSDLVYYIEKKEAEIRVLQKQINEEFNPKTRSLTLINELIMYKKELVGGSRLGLAVYVLEITAPKKKKDCIPYEKRQVVVFQGRQHPSETPSSFIIEGLIDFLLNIEDPIAIKLREIFIFKIVPMVNPDGVFVGNSRTNISGADLNREWENCSETLHPEIYFLKQYFSQLSQIFAFWDIHASSSKLNAFSYGSEQSQGLSSNFNWVGNRLLLKIMHESMNYFHYQMCQFSLTNKNQQSARAVFYKQLNAKFSFNYDVSIYGYQFNSHFQLQNFKQDQKNKLIQQLETGQINYDEYMELKDSIFAKIDSEKDQQQSLIQIDKDKDEEQQQEDTQKQTSQKINEDEKIIQFDDLAYKNMGKEILHNLLKFALMYAYMFEESEKNKTKDLSLQNVTVQNNAVVKQEPKEKKNLKNLIKKNSSFFSSKKNSPISRKGSSAVNSPLSQTQTPAKKRANFFTKLNSKLQENNLENSQILNIINDVDQEQNENAESRKKNITKISNFTTESQKVLTEKKSPQGELQKKIPLEVSTKKSTQKQQNKKNLFVEYILSQKTNIENLFPNMRSFQWRDYFSIPELEQQFGDEDLQQQIIQNLGVKNLDHDTDSDPEDDLLLEYKSKYYNKEMNEDEYDEQSIQKRQLLYQQVNEKFGSSKYAEFLDILSQNDLNLLLQGKLQIDEQGNIIRPEKKPENILLKKGSSIFKRQNSVNINSPTSTTNKMKASQFNPEYGNIMQQLNNKIQLQEKKSIDNNDLDNATKNKTNEGFDEEDQKNNLKSQNFFCKYDFKQFANQNKSKISSSSKYLRPKIEVIKVKNPFLPSYKKVYEQYQLKNIEKMLSTQKKEKINPKKFFITTFCNTPQQQDNNLTGFQNQKDYASKSQFSLNSQQGLRKIRNQTEWSQQFIKSEHDQQLRITNSLFRKSTGQNFHSKQEKSTDANQKRANSALSSIKAIVFYQKQQLQKQIKKKDEDNIKVQNYYYKINKSSNLYKFYESKNNPSNANIKRNLDYYKQ